MLTSQPKRAGDAVVGPPGPDVVDQDVVAVDLEGDGGLADVRPTDPEEHVADSVVGLRGSLQRTSLPCARADPQQDRRFDRAGVDRDAGDDHARARRRCSAGRRR